MLYNIIILNKKMQHTLFMVDFNSSKFHSLNIHDDHDNIYMHPRIYTITEKMKLILMLSAINMHAKTQLSSFSLL